MDSAGLRFPTCLVLHKPTFAVPVGRSCRPELGWTGLGVGRLRSSRERLLDAIKSEPAAGSWRHSEY